MGLQNAFQQNYPKIWQNFQEKWSNIGLQRVFQNDNSWFDKIFKEELFGPVVTAFVYKDADAMKMVDQIGKDTPYALTGALYSEDQ